MAQVAPMPKPAGEINWDAQRHAITFALKLTDLGRESTRPGRKPPAQASNTQGAAPASRAAMSFADRLNYL